MIDLLQNSSCFAVLLTIGAFAVGQAVRQRIGRDIANPLLIAVLLVIAVLLLLDIDVETYQSGAQLISWLLTPATVCLALPLSRQINVLRRNAAAAVTGVLMGVLSSAVLITLLVFCFGLNAREAATLLSKSVTTAIGVSISEELGGIPALTVAAISLSGLCGNLTARPLCRLLKITDPVARGLAIGASSHAIGTVKALEMGEIEGAMSSAAVAVCGLVTVFAAPLFMRLFI